MLRPSICDSAPSAKAREPAAKHARGSAIAWCLLALIGAAMFFCVLAAPLFVPLLIG